MIRSRLRLAGFLSCAFYCPSAMAEVPADIELLREVSALVDAEARISKPSLQLLNAQLVALVLEQVDSIASARAYPDWFSADNPIIAKQVRDTVNLGLQSAINNPSTLHKVTIATVSGLLAEEAMARAAGVTLPPSTRKDTLVSLGSSATATGGGALALNLGDSFITGDTGSFGSANGALDAGESATLNLVFENASDRRLMSTSIYLDSMSDCLWTPMAPFREQELPELMPGANTKIAVEFYLSSTCKASIASLTLHAFDSHAFADSPLEFRVVFPVLKIGGTSLLSSVRIDSDDYGFSEPSKARPLQPNDRVELSAGLSVPSKGWTSVHQVFSVPIPLQSWHEPAPTKPAWSSATNTSTAPVADDVDILVPPKEQLQRGLEAWALHYGWETREDAKLFVAVDSLVTRGEKETTADPTTNPWKASHEGTRVNRAQVERVLAEHVGVQPIVQRDKGGEGLPLVSVNGFRVYVEDPDAMMSALEAIAPSTTTSSSARKEPPNKVPTNSSTSYHLRHYIALPIAWTPKAPVPITCSIHGPSGPTTAGEFGTLTGSVRNRPSNTSVQIQFNGKTWRPTVAPNGIFKIQVKSMEPRLHTAEIEVMVGSDLRCSALTQVQIVEAVTEAPVSTPTPVASGIRRWSVEPRMLLTTFGNSEMIGPGFMATVGEESRFAFGIEQPTDGWSTDYFTPLLGYRRTSWQQPYPDSAQIEFSTQLLLGLPYLETSEVEGVTLMFRPSIQLAVHSGFGVFLEFGAQTWPLTNLTDAAFYGSLGLGFYFPKE